MAGNEEISLDCNELRRLASITTRESVRCLLAKHIQELEEKFICTPVSLTAEDKDKEEEKDEEEKEEDSLSGKEPIPTPKPTDSSKVLVSRLATKTITSYGWDQSPKFVKVYVTLDGVHKLAKGDVTVEYTPWSFMLQVKKTDCIYQLTVNSLLEELIPDKSHHKVKTDNLVIYLKKSSEKNWDYFTKTEKKAKQKKSLPKPENSGDPSAGIMNLMKHMYDDGDDEMKRTIAKAWTEARDKKDTLELP